MSGALVSYTEGVLKVCMTLWAISRMRKAAVHESLLESLMVHPRHVRYEQSFDILNFSVGVLSVPAVRFAANTKHS